MVLGTRFPVLIFCSSTSASSTWSLGLLQDESPKGKNAGTCYGQSGQSRSTALGLTVKGWGPSGNLDFWINETPRVRGSKSRRILAGGVCWIAGSCGRSSRICGIRLPPRSSQGRLRRNRSCLKRITRKCRRVSARCRCSTYGFGWGWVYSYSSFVNGMMWFGEAYAFSRSFLSFRTPLLPSFGGSDLVISEVSTVTAKDAKISSTSNFLFPNKPSNIFFGGKRFLIELERQKFSKLYF